MRRGSDDKRVAFISTPRNVLNSRSNHVRNEGSVSYEDRSFITRMIFQLTLARSRCANEGYPYLTITARAWKATRMQSGRLEITR